ncbi:beta-lactamase/transpeptidase-like protein [Cryphonectria parasitica EP155]|uniref:Beta-lactamase/transpeptidase-like protein n=1 Tax=Cryphonectria parasitica (strain ATCC 38755 / EP155) TaxID=660469 RepID=A0A9P4Y4E1_CRYP1|nr:beta-lactamase/transpeptidase-like protein [Cryphonectria parasitica EP155]KAF3766259.1 beta-lactamase/transpeptidase-like protein [Cryphonectria parasitica EP155]
MTNEFDQLLAECTKKGSATVHGALMKCVDKNGKVLYQKTVGYNSLSEDAAPLREDATLRVASATKFITSVALLQCVERGQIGLDEPMTSILPELQGKEILERAIEGSAEALTTRPSQTAITARHLLTHMSGLGYAFMHPLLTQWMETGAASRSDRLTERYNQPLAFEPGQGWLYGTSLDWAGVAVSRMNGGVTLEEYMVENIWKAVGRPAPYPVFHVSQHPEYEARLMRAAERTEDGGLKPSPGTAFLAGLVDDEGGAGLTLTADDYVAVLQDLVSDAPRLLRPETIARMLEPQIPDGSPAHPMLIELKPAWEMVAGPARDEHVNHGLGGLLVLEEVPEIAQPKNILCWGGASNISWFICKERGVAGFFATQMSPFGDPVVRELVNGWKKDFWTSLGKL